MAAELGGLGMDEAALLALWREWSAPAFQARTPPGPIASPTRQIPPPGDPLFLR
ncbi:hypothetical protein [Kibdelosporangium philippinense]|uniref:hypothetical protein n=1 Tax=Kibdelosporangium philippinense TaxID=211113 RepID=UPI00360A3178